MTRLHERRWTQDRTAWATKITSTNGYVLRTHWERSGPWHGEPDKVQWLHQETDLDCLAVRNHFGAWCGYVGLPPDHPLHGKEYDEVHTLVDLDPEDAHGGLTFAASCEEEAPEGYGICHVPLPGRPGEVWWLGFDCGHLMDFAPRVVFYEDMPSLRYLGEPEVYRTLDYVQDVCERLAVKLAQHTGRGEE